MIGILEPSSTLSSPPGTCLFDPSTGAAPDAVGLKHEKNHPEIILRPQPSDDPNDPLNFSRVRKELIYATLILGSSITGVCGPLYVPFISGLAEAFDSTISGQVVITGYLVLSYGIASLGVVIACGLAGRRIQYLWTTALLFASLIYGASTTSYKSLLAARILQGVGLSGFGCLGSSTISDVFFLHEQGWRIAVWQLAFNGSVSVAPLISGIVIQQTSWQVATYILAGFSGFILLCVIFVFPETSYRRNPPVERNANGSVDTSPEEKSEKEDGFVVDTTRFVELSRRQSSYWSSLKPWGTRTNDETVLTLLARPVVLLFTPSIFFSMLLYTFSFSWSVIMSAIYSPVFGAPPYNLSVAAVGYISGVGPFVGVVTALLIAGPLSDLTARHLSRKNYGIFEPEMRLVPVIPGALLATVGSFGLGFSIQAGGSYWGPAVLVGILYAGVSFILFSAISYAAAAYPARGGDTFGIIMICKAFFAWGVLQIISDWYATKGPINVFVTLGSITLFLSLCSVPMYIFGKLLRQWTAQTPALAWALL